MFPDSSTLQEWAESLGDTGSQIIEQFSDYDSPIDFLNDTANTFLDILDDLQNNLPEDAQNILDWFVRIDRNDCENCITYFPTDPIMPIRICIRNPHCRFELPPSSCTRGWEPPIGMPTSEEDAENIMQFFPDGLPPRCPIGLPSLPQNPNGSYGEPGKIYKIEEWQDTYEIFTGVIIHRDFPQNRIEPYLNITPRSLGIRRVYYLTAPIYIIQKQSVNLTTPTSSGDGKGSGIRRSTLIEDTFRRMGCATTVWQYGTLAVDWFTRYDYSYQYNFIYSVVEGIESPEVSSQPEETYPPTGQPNDYQPDEGNNMNQDCCSRLERRMQRLEDWIFKIGRWTGSFEGGMLVPELLHTINADGNPQGYASRIINNIPEFYVWYIEKFQEFLGEWSFKITDEKENELTFPNVAKALESVLTKTMAQDRAIAAIQQGLVKACLEVALTRQEAVFGKSVADAIADFLEIPLDEKTVEILHQFTLPPDVDIAPEDVDTDKEIEDFFNSSYFNAKIVEFDPNKKVNGKKPETYGTLAKRILRIMEILLAVHSIPINKDTIEADLKRFVGNLRKFSKGEALDGRTIGTDDDNDLTQYLEKIETMFSAEENAPTDAAISPWGNSVEERPKIIVRGVQPTEGDDM